MTAKIPDNYISRKAEILALFIQVLESHMDDFMAGRIEKMHDLKQIASIIGQSC